MVYLLIIERRKNKMYYYKIDVVQALAEKGYNSYKIKKDNLMSQGTLKKLKEKQNVTLETLNSICCMLRCNIEDVIKIVPTDEEKIKYF